VQTQASTSASTPGGEAILKIACLISTLFAVALFGFALISKADSTQHRFNMTASYAASLGIIVSGDCGRTKTGDASLAAASKSLITVPFNPTVSGLRRGKGEEI
jgi:hypothetical protein